MGRHDWYRSTEWSSEIEAAFFRKLGRARDKRQYLRIQAAHLVKAHPDVALRLLGEYFRFGEHFDLAQAFVDQAQAHLALGDIEAALASYERALDRERVYPNVTTQAYLEFALLVVKKRKAPLYSRVLDELNRRRDEPLFPIDRYRLHGARALILKQLNRDKEATQSAELAAKAAGETHSGLRNHPKLGLVEQTNDEFDESVKAIVS